MLSYLLYAFIWLLSFLPLWILYGLSDVLYILLYYVVGYRRKVVRRNLANAFPEKSVPEVIRIEKRYYRHMCDVFIEFYKSWHISEKEIRRRCVFKNPELAQRYCDGTKGVVAVMGHYANWEWLTSVTLWAGHERFFPLYKPLHNKVLDKLTFKIRSRFGAVPVPKNDLMRLLVNNKGKGFMVGFISDQTPNRQNLNFWTSFLNQDTPVFVGTERIARKYNMPVVWVRMRKLRRGHYEVEFLTLCEEPEKLEPGELTRMHTRMLESFIREEPEYWLWSHRRWKHKRENTTQVK